MSTTITPPTITGGCLCGAIRYQVTFNEEGQWPPKSQTCHCTTCRKFTGTLQQPFLSISSPETQISPAFDTFPEYREFTSSPNRYRGFCSKCGSSLCWRSERRGESFDLLLGSLDYVWLAGEGDVHGATREVRDLLCRPTLHFWWKNAIEGVTDCVKEGKKWETNETGYVEGV